MRQANHDVEWLEDGEEFVGLRLGYSFVAAHEFGTSGIDAAFGIRRDPSLAMLEQFSATRCPAGLSLVEFMAHPKPLGNRAQRRASAAKRGRKPPAPSLECALLLLDPGSIRSQPDESEIRRHVEASPLGHEASPGLACLWDESGFAVYASGRDNVDKLKMLEQAMRRLDVSLGGEAVGGWVSNTVDRAGRPIARVGRNPPCFLINSRLSPELRQGQERHFEAMSKVLGLTSSAPVGAEQTAEC